MGRIKDITGNIYGRLYVLHQYGIPNSGDVKWLCKCECGNFKSIRGSSLRTGNTKSCGCFFPESVRERFTTHGSCPVGNKTSEYRSWDKMKSRCLNKNHKHFKHYGGRGIKICDRWLESFENFLRDMGLKPSPEYTLDRFPDVNGDYEPSNCRWATQNQQHRNKTNNIWIEYGDEKMVVADWAKKLNISFWRVQYHHRKGRSIGDIIKMVEKQK